MSMLVYNQSNKVEFCFFKNKSKSLKFHLCTSLHSLLGLLCPHFSSYQLSHFPLLILYLFFPHTLCSRFFSRN